MSENIPAVLNDPAIMPQTFDGMMKQAEVLVKSGLLPTEIKTGPQALAIMLTGRELGIPPMQAFRSVYVVKGKPTLSAQLMGALILRAGHSYRVVESTDAQCVIEFRRRGQDYTYRHEFTLEDAKQASLLGNVTWKAYPKAMLFSRCMSAGARVAMPDVLAGMYTPEEFADEGQVVLDEGGAVIDVLPSAREQRDNAPPVAPKRNGGNPMYRQEQPAKSEPVVVEDADHPHWIDEDKVRKAFWAYIERLGLDGHDVHLALGTNSVKEFTGTMADAKTMIEEYVTEQSRQGEEGAALDGVMPPVEELEF